MNQKTLTSLLAGIIFLIISFFFGGNYVEHQENIAENQTISTESKKSGKNFSLSNIQQVDNVEFYYTPYMRLNEQIIAEIDSARREVLLEVYMFTETRIFDALKRAHERGVKVQVVLEQYPYMAASVNRKLHTALSEAGIDVVWSDSSDYKLNHAKFLIIDDAAYISTGNMTYSTFKHNRDFFIYINDKNIVTTLKQIFADDYQGEKVTRYHENLVVAPVFSRSKLETMLMEAKSSVKIYMQYFLDARINSLLKNIKQEKNINIQILVDKKNINSEEVQDLQAHGIEVQTIKTKIHAKALLVDEQYLFIGSENFSKSSLDYNREMGIILQDADIVKKFLKVFSTDWEQ